MLNTLKLLMDVDNYSNVVLYHFTNHRETSTTRIRLVVAHKINCIENISTITDYDV